VLDRFNVNFNETVKNARVEKVERKMEQSDRKNPNSPMQPAHDKDGVPKYTVHLSVETNNFDKTKFDHIAVTVASRERLDEVLPEGKVTVEGFTLGLMPQGKNTYSVFFMAEAIRPLQPAQFTQPGPATRVVPGQPPQPVRVGQ
jgi:hypothetical protein